MDQEAMTTIVAADAKERDHVVGLGDIVAKPTIIGAFIALDIRRPVWSLVTGLRDFNHETLVLHLMDTIVVVQRED